MRRGEEETRGTGNSRSRSKGDGGGGGGGGKAISSINEVAYLTCLTRSLSLSVWASLSGCEIEQAQLPGSEVNGGSEEGEKKERRYQSVSSVRAIGVFAKILSRSVLVGP